MVINVQNNGIGWYGDDGNNGNIIKDIAIGTLYDARLYTWVAENLTKS
jgi:hypothetical protein